MPVCMDCGRKIADVQAVLWGYKCLKCGEKRVRSASGRYYGEYGEHTEHYGGKE